jgi:hypothetical protein
MATFQSTQLLKGREGYRQRANGDLERVEGGLVYVIVRQLSSFSRSRVIIRGLCFGSWLGRLETYTRS